MRNFLHLVLISLILNLLAYKVKIVKWLLTVFLWASAASLCLHADAAGDLYNKANNAFAANDFKTAAADYDRIISDYPSTANIDDIHIRAGLSYLHLGDNAKVISELTPEVASTAAPANRAVALFYTGYAQLLGASKLAGPDRANMFNSSAGTMTQLIQLVTASPTPDVQPYLEEAYYNRALAHFYADQLPDSQKDLETLLNHYPASLRKPDYLLLLGNLFAREASSAIAAKAPASTIQASIDEALQAFNQVSGDSTALVQANDATLAAAETLYLVASLHPADPQGYEKALDAFRRVRSKNDLIPLQLANVNKLRTQNQQQVSGGLASVSDANSRLIEREEARLDSLKTEPDPIIQALIRIGECYNSMREGNEARTVLHRLAQANLNQDQQKEVDFAVIYSYVLAHRADKADQALTAYLAKYPGDAQAQSISVQIGNNLLDLHDYNGALEQANRSLHDFPTGANVPDAIGLKARALTGLNQLDAAKAVENDFLSKNPASSAALSLLISRAQGEAAQGDLTTALADYKTVANNPAAGALQAAADGGYIQTLQALGRTDEVIAACNDFATKFPTNVALPNILVLRAVALDQKHDPGAIAALQDIARKYPADTPSSASPFALFYVVNIYQRDGKVPQMVQAASDLQKSFPTQYTLILQAADLVSGVLIKERQFDQAIAQYQPLTTASDPAVAALASDQIGNVWLKAARAMGAYQSMQQPADRDEAQKKLGSGEAAFINVLKSYPGQLNAVDQAFRGLDSALVQRRSWGLLKEADFGDYLTKLTSGLTEAKTQARVALAKAGLVFVEKDGRKEYPAALSSFSQTISANPGLVLTRLEANRYGELLLSAQQYATAIQVYTQLLESDPKSQEVQADGDYGLGATYLAQGDVNKAKDYFLAMKRLNGGAAWHPHIADADFGLALAAEQSGQPADLDSAKNTYATLMQSPQASVELQAKSILGYARILAKEGHTTQPAVAGSIEYAVHYDQQVDAIYGPAVPELSAEGLYAAGQIYDQAGDKVNAQKQYQTIETNYKTTAPDWAAKAESALAKG